jgi:hypothetical protein
MVLVVVGSASADQNACPSQIAPWLDHFFPVIDEENDEFTRYHWATIGELMAFFEQYWAGNEEALKWINW